MPKSRKRSKAVASKHGDVTLTVVSRKVAVTRSSRNNLFFDPLPLPKVPDGPGYPKGLLPLYCS